MVNLEWVFLVYVGRSGSTFFASELAKATSEILVLPETKIVDILLGIEDGKFRLMRSNEKLEAIKKDPRWVNLDVSDNEFTSLCTEQQTAGQLLNDIVRLLAKRHEISPSQIMVKNGASVWHYKKIVRAFPTARFVHVCRDPRGSTASRMNKMPVYKNKAGARLSDPWFLSMHWIRYIKRVEWLKKEGWGVYQVAYEDMMRNPEITIHSYLNHLGIVSEAVGKNAFRLSEKEESGKHANVNSPPIAKRLDAWKSELSHDNGVLIEMLCSNYISEKYFRKQTGAFYDCKILVMGFIRHLGINTRRILERSSS